MKYWGSRCGCGTRLPIPRGRRLYVRYNGGSYFDDGVVDSPNNARFLVGQRTLEDELTFLSRSRRLCQSPRELILHFFRCSTHPVTAAALTALYQFLRATAYML